ncbi:hypothetical protein OK016_20585 [Vibrio chagasii]|nr:hypothetical protein [Vibrio chagasii]
MAHIRSSAQFKARVNSTQRLVLGIAMQAGWINTLLIRVPIFLFSETNGITLSRRSADGKHVVGADFHAEFTLFSDQ